MPATKMKFGKCGHRGWGAECRRCLQADKLEKDPPRGMRPDDVKAEVARLRGPQRKKGHPGPAMDTITLS